MIISCWRITVILIPVFILTLVNSIRKIRPMQLPVLQTAPVPKLTVPAIALNGKNEDLDWIRCPFCGKIYSGGDGNLIDRKSVV